jgi:4-hydroxy-tetrahydrodipicolinate synthase
MQTNTLREADAAKANGGRFPVANKQDARSVLCGPMVPVISHYGPDLSLDLAALEKNIEHLIRHGVRTGNGCLLIGGAGADFPMLTLEERKEVVSASAKAVAGRVPIVIGGQSTDERTILALAELAEELGAYAIQLGPHYYFRPSDRDVVSLFRTVNETLRNTGIMVYNTWWTGYNMPTAVLDELMDLDRVVSLKWSTPEGALGYMQGVARYANRVAVIDNNNTWPLTAMLGGSGFITHLTSIWPKHDLELYALTREGKYSECIELMRTADWPFIDFREKMAARTSGEGSVVRAALELCGMPGGPSRSPARELTQEERDELREILVRIGAPVVDNVATST